MRKNIDLEKVQFTIYKDNKVFGDGEHETTKFMMDAIQKYGVKDKSVIDIGTGTGILSVLCAKLGAKHILAIDNDVCSLEWAKKNFRKNNVSVEVEIGDLLRDTDEKADVILANLPGELQLENIISVEKNLNENGLFICTWFNTIPFEEWTSRLNWEVVEYFRGSRDYDGYVLKQKDKK